MTPRSPRIDGKVKARLLSPKGLVLYAQIPPGVFANTLPLKTLIQQRAESIVSIYRGMYAGKDWAKPMTAVGGLSRQALFQAKLNGELSLQNTRKFDITFASAVSMYDNARRALKRYKHGDRSAPGKSEEPPQSETDADRHQELDARGPGTEKETASSTRQPRSVFEEDAMEN